MTVAQVPPATRSIRYVKGVGPNRLTQLQPLGIETVEDACYYAPRRYEDRTHLAAIKDLRPGEIVTVRARVLARSLRRIRRGQTLVEAAVGDATGVLYALWFNQPYLAEQLKVDEELILYGQVEPRPRLSMIHPELERVGRDDDPAGSTGSLHMGRIVPIYPLAGGLTQRWFRQMIASTLERHRADLDDPLPEALRAARGFPALTDAVRQLHFPDSWDALERARERLAFEELFLFQLALAQRRARFERQAKPQRYRRDGPLLQGLLAHLPFTLTAGQQRVLEELLEDLCRSAPMHRLLQGDVGCGKTVVMAALIAVAVQSGCQAAVMAPTELLAEQHARVMGGWLSPLGVSVGLLTQGVPAADRARRERAIAEGALPVVVGTHALLQTRVVFRNLTLVLIDEQHKFGVVQRAHLAKKAAMPDVLVVTATPIPRTLALSIYGDLELSTISELPAGRRPVTTRWLGEADRQALYELIRRELAQGRQGYVVYPLVEERQGQVPGALAGARHLKAVTQMAKHLQAEVFQGFRVGLLHGQMRPKAKEQTMLAFARGELQLLVSTVIVEVGLDVPNATIMVIEHPERFGLAQLHQLRGRIGRGEHPAICIVVSDSAEEAVRQRLAAFVETADGFALAEQDLEQRGPGELLGRRQHGWMRWRIANLIRDRGLLESAREEAIALIRRDPALRGSALAGLRARLTR